MNDRINLFWDEFLKCTGKRSTTRYIEAFHFERNERLASELLELVLKGQKKATCSSLYYYEITGTRQPMVADYNIITDWNGNPKCIIQTISVIIKPFKDIDFKLCSHEGEDDTLESWRRGHEKYFKAEGEELGYEFNEDMPVVFEDFEVVYPL